jgi:hypothetical protein
MYKDTAGSLWVGGGGSGLVRFDERTGRFKHYRHNPEDPNSLISDNVYTLFGDTNGQMWVGQVGGLSRFDPARDGFTNYRPVPDRPASLENTVWVIDQDRSGTLWLGTRVGVLVRVDDKTNTFVNYLPDARNHGAEIFTQVGVRSLEQKDGLWLIHYHGLDSGREHFDTPTQFITANTVVLAAGTTSTYTHDTCVDVPARLTFMVVELPLTPSAVVRRNIPYEICVVGIVPVPISVQPVPAVIEPSASQSQTAMKPHEPVAVAVNDWAIVDAETDPD